MQINWFTVIAQVINFIILVWLLKRFLYKPILDAIDERENKITSQLQQAEAKKAEAQKEQDQFKQKNDAFDKQKAGLLKDVTSQTDAEREKLLSQAKDEAAAFSVKQQKAWEESQENLRNEIAKKTQEQVFSITRKTLSDLASIDLERQITHVFLSRLSQLNQEEKQVFTGASKMGTEPVYVRSAFELPVEQQSRIKKEVKTVLEKEPEFRFETAPELVSGIELTINGYKLSWTISEYMNSLEKSILEKPIEIPATKPEKI